MIKEMDRAVHQRAKTRSWKQTKKLRDRLIGWRVGDGTRDRG